MLKRKNADPRRIAREVLLNNGFDLKPEIATEMRRVKCRRGNQFERLRRIRGYEPMIDREYRGDWAAKIDSGPVVELVVNPDNGISTPLMPQKGKKIYQRMR